MDTVRKTSTEGDDPQVSEGNVLVDFILAVGDTILKYDGKHFIFPTVLL